MSHVTKHVCGLLSSAVLFGVLGCSIIIDTDDFTYGETGDGPLDTGSGSGDTDSGSGRTHPDTGTSDGDTGTGTGEADTGTGTGDGDTGTGTGTGEVDTGTGTAVDSATETGAETDVPTDTGPDTPTDTGTGTGMEMETASETGTVCPGWLDKDYNLCWEMPHRPAPVRYSQVGAQCEALGDGWVVPTIEQLRMLIRGCPSTEYVDGPYEDGACEINNDSDPSVISSGCGGCADDPGPGRAPTASGCYWPDEFGMDVNCAALDDPTDVIFWSSTADTSYADPVVLAVDYNTGAIRSFTAVSTGYYALRCVKPLD